jgi:hypothetical protein
MKLLLTFVLCCVLTGAFAQVPKSKVPEKLQVPDSVRMFKGNDGRSLQKQLEVYPDGEKVSKSLLGNKQGDIAFLPQDHMPCVVPDSTSAAMMPNAWSGAKVPFQPGFRAIPNPALPKQP